LLHVRKRTGKENRCRKNKTKLDKWGGGGGSKVAIKEGKKKGERKRNMLAFGKGTR